MEGLARRAWRLKVRDQLTDPWTLLLSAGGGGVAWALHTPGVLAAAVTAGMLAVAGVTSVFRDTGTTDVEDVRLRRGTEQAALLDALDGYLKDLRDLRQSQRLPPSLRSSAIDALVAAGGARASAAKVAEAVDSLDEAMARAGNLARNRTVSAATRATLARMAGRRTDLLARLGGALTEVQDVHANLLELSATVELTAGAGDLSEVTEVNQRLEALRASFTALEGDARAAITP
jgi:hypothetical protein